MLPPIRHEVRVLAPHCTQTKRRRRTIDGNSTSSASPSAAKVSGFECRHAAFAHVTNRPSRPRVFRLAMASNSWMNGSLDNVGRPGDGGRPGDRDGGRRGIGAAAELLHGYLQPVSRVPEERTGQPLQASAGVSDNERGRIIGREIISCTLSYVWPPVWALTKRPPRASVEHFITVAAIVPIRLSDISCTISNSIDWPLAAASLD
jgi:hypothetical protein